MANPSKPTHVKVSALNRVLADLQSIQQDVSEPPAGTFDEVNGSLETDLRGMQGNVAHVVGQRYGDNTRYINYAWTEVTAGIQTLTTLIQQTIGKHQGADDNAAQGAQQTNTSQAGGTLAKE